jgi:hypothetical protein
MHEDEPDKERPRISKKNLYQCHFIHHKPHITVMGSFIVEQYRFISIK